ncbi:hypothetical protein EDD37DRAFT_48730 [Exophiala viscosa]|uniref:uncharacterized protein n=1 Tax=Exophiala viscosa TaxID=2486360 RepID=UPI0021938F8C|nr:hypothetical protein EDD37DRAFT_48730 [Exophiala viscosa]
MFCLICSHMDCTFQTRRFSRSANAAGSWIFPSRFHDHHTCTKGKQRQCVVVAMVGGHRKVTHRHVLLSPRNRSDVSRLHACSRPTQRSQRQHLCYRPCLGRPLGLRLLQCGRKSSSQRCVHRYHFVRETCLRCHDFILITNEQANHLNSSACFCRTQRRSDCSQSIPSLCSAIWTVHDALLILREAFSQAHRVPNQFSEKTELSASFHGLTCCAETSPPAINRPASWVRPFRRHLSATCSSSNLPPTSPSSVSDGVYPLPRYRTSLYRSCPQRKSHRHSALLLHPKTTSHCDLNHRKFICRATACHSERRNPNEKLGACLRIKHRGPRQPSRLATNISLTPTFV